MAKKKIFISHSSEDKKIIDILIKILEHYLANGKTISTYDVTYSSSDKKIYRFGLGANIGDKSIKLAGESDIFIAYISEDYKKSEISMAELGCGYFNHLKMKPGFIFMPIKDDFVNFNDLTFVLNNQTVLSKSFDNIISFFDSVFRSRLTKNIKIILKNKFDLIYSGFDYELNLSKKNIRDYVVKTFNKSNPLKSYTFIQYVTRKLYNEFHIDLSKLGEDELLWTAYKSPFNIKKIELDLNNLTKWDVEFAKVHSNRKKRIIIFDSAAEKDYFFNDKIHSKDEKLRKKAFLNANKITPKESCLYFSLKENLVDEYNNQNIPDKINPAIYGPKNELYLEFAYIKSIKHNLEILVFSDYDNSYTTIQNDTEPLVFISPNDNASKYQQKIIDSLHINKMITFRFDELIMKNIITKI
jgi:hypothetical protein